MPSPHSAVRGPDVLSRLSRSEVDRLLDRLDASLSPGAPYAEIAPAGAMEATVFGDTHGDWRSTEAAAERFLAHPEVECLVGLGDYIDRPPADCPGGSVVNILYLLTLKAAYPDRVFLIQGNHEIVRRIPVFPHTLPDELEAMWGADSRRYGRIMELVERGPLAGYTSTGVFLSHGGFPTRPRGVWNEWFRRPDDALFFDLMWRDAAASALDRGLGAPFDGEELQKFLRAAGLSVFLRGHDPDVTGIPLYSGRCLTLHTCRLFERYGGVIVARVPLSLPVRSLADVTVDHLRTEGSRRS